MKHDSPLSSAAFVLAALAVSAVLAVSMGGTLADDLDTREVENLVVEHTNELRDDEELPRLERHPGLSDVARSHSRDLERESELQHAGVDGEAWFARYLEGCPGYKHENVAHVRWGHTVVDDFDDFDDLDVDEDDPPLYDTGFFDEVAGRHVMSLDTEDEVARALVTLWHASDEHRFPYTREHHS